MASISTEKVSFEGKCQTIEHTWKIPNFMREERQKVEGEIFHVPNDTKWCLRIYPKGDKARGGDGYLSVYVILKSAGQRASPAVLAKITELKLPSSNATECKELARTFDQYYPQEIITTNSWTNTADRSSAWGYPKFIQGLSNNDVIPWVSHTILNLAFLSFNFLFWRFSPKT